MRRPLEVQQLIDAVRTGDSARVTAQLEARPEIINMDASELNRGVDSVEPDAQPWATPRQLRIGQNGTKKSH